MFQFQLPPQCSSEKRHARVVGWFVRSAHARSKTIEETKKEGEKKEEKKKKEKKKKKKKKKEKKRKTRARQKITQNKARFSVHEHHQAQHNNNKGVSNVGFRQRWTRATNDSATQSAQLDDTNSGGCERRTATECFCW